MPQWAERATHDVDREPVPPRYPDGWQPDRAPVDQTPVRRSRGQLISFVSHKGGTGKSTVAVLSAAILAEAKKDKRVLLVDGNAGQASQRTILEMRQNSPSIADLWDRPFSAAGFRDVISRVEGTNLDVLLGPARLQDSSPIHITPDLYHKCIDVALTQYDYVLLDTPVAQVLGREPIMERLVLPYSDQLVVIVAPLNETISNNKDWLTVVTSPMATSGGANFDKSRVRIVLNRYSDDVGWSIEGVKGLFAEYPWLGVIPEDREVVRAENNARLHLDSGVVREEMLAILARLIGDESIMPVGRQVKRAGMMGRLRNAVNR
jgi:pilus assembly protein CpaE